MKYLYRLCLLIGFTSLSLASTFIDVDECNFKLARGIRIATYNTAQQRFLSICYYNYPLTQYNPDQWFLTDSLGLSYSYSGNVHIPENYNHKDVIVRTRGIIVNSKAPIQKTTNNKHIMRPYWWSSKSPAIHPNKIFSILMNFTNYSEGNYPIIIDNTFKSHDDIKSKKERGILGELATELTFEEYGYSKLPSQNRSNQGLDGVYVDNIRQPLHLFLTESKYRAENKTAESYMEDDLNEEQICDKMTKAHPETRDAIKSFLDNKPFGIFKIVHRISKGNSQICVRKFDQRAYRSLLLKTPLAHLSARDAVDILEDLLEKMTIIPHQNIGYIPSHSRIAKVKIKRVLDHDSADLFEEQLDVLSPAKIKVIREKVETVPEPKRQVVFDIVFRHILGYAENTDHILKNQLLDTIDSVALTLGTIPVEDHSHAMKISDIIFGSVYEDVEPDHFELEDRLCIFNEVFKFPNIVQLTPEVKLDVLYAYHIIYNSLRSIGGESDDIRDMQHLSDLVQKFRALDDANLRNISNSIAEIYDTQCYSNLKSKDSIEEWEDLADELMDLSIEHRELLIDFINYLPPALDMHPVDAIKGLKPKISNLEQLDDFEAIGNLVARLFVTEKDGDQQLRLLKQIIDQIIKAKDIRTIEEEIMDELDDSL